MGQPVVLQVSHDIHSLSFVLKEINHNVSLEDI
uniref:Uncharacterized protein n=1 Tax=Amphimedon queenslandica TaxID=400682 RepID=A0A1X7TQS6_AMPQE